MQHPFTFQKLSNGTMPCEVPQNHMEFTQGKFIYYDHNHIKYFSSKYQLVNMCRNKQLEMHGFILSTADTDALVLKHQAISTHCTK